MRHGTLRRTYGSLLALLALLALAAACSSEPVPGPDGGRADVARDSQGADVAADALADVVAMDRADVPTGPCPGNQFRCDGECVDIGTTAQHCGGCGRACPAGEVCVAGGCVCPLGQRACNGMCTDVATDEMNCGECGRVCAGGTVCMSGNCACPPGMNLCAGTCRNTQSDPMACGSACRVCSATGGMATCTMGTCGIACMGSLRNCDGNLANGCEADVNTSLGDCGMCGNACPIPPNTTGTCTTGMCGFTCNAGRGNCDGNNDNGCESDIRSNLAHCGACGRACAMGPAQNTECNAGTCEYACNGSFRDCDMDPATGCEVDPTSDARNCGGCGVMCAPPTAPNMVAICMNSSCTGRCAPGFLNCDGAMANGCEVNRISDATNCGACGVRCTGAEMCVDGACVPR